LPSDIKKGATRARLRRWLAIVGPGLLASLAGDDAGGLATTSAIGARFGYDLLWALLALTVCLAVVQEMAARLGAATGRGLLDLVRERYGIGWALLAISAILLANAGIMVTEFAGIGAAGELLGTPRAFAILLSAGLIWYLVLYGDYRAVERVFLCMTLVFAAYPVAAVLARPDWGSVARGLLVPRLPAGRDWTLLVALIGTTITPYQQLFQQSAVVEKGVARRHYLPQRVDAYLGAVLGNLIWAFVILASAATLGSGGRLDTAADAARALRPLVGDAAEVLFGVGLLGASLLAAAVVPLATAYAVSEAFGFPKGVNLQPRRAPIYFGLFTALMVIGVVGALAPGIPVIALLIGTQVLNGLLLPVVLAFIVILSAQHRLMSNLRPGRMSRALTWLTLLLATLAAVAFVLNLAGSV
jgi:Mn2+/Fe2+ NRAMP family transporter